MADVHAEPLETAMSSIPSAATRLPRRQSSCSDCRAGDAPPNHSHKPRPDSLRMLSRSWSRNPARRLDSSAISSPADLAGLPQTDEAAPQRAGAHAALVSAAIDLRHQLHPRVLRAHVQRADSLRAIHLVRRKRQQVDLIGVHVDRKLAHPCTASVWNSTPARGRACRFPPAAAARRSRYSRP